MSGGHREATCRRVARHSRTVHACAPYNTRFMAHSVRSPPHMHRCVSVCGRWRVYGKGDAGSGSYLYPRWLPPAVTASASLLLTSLVCPKACRTADSRRTQRAARLQRVLPRRGCPSVRSVRQAGVRRVQGRDGAHRANHAAQCSRPRSHLVEVPCGAHSANPLAPCPLPLSPPSNPETVAAPLRPHACPACGASPSTAQAAVGVRASSTRMGARALGFLSGSARVCGTHTLTRCTAHTVSSALSDAWACGAGGRNGGWGRRTGGRRTPTRAAASGHGRSHASAASSLAHPRVCPHAGAR